MLTEAQIPAHRHDGSALAAGRHKHSRFYKVGGSSLGFGVAHTGNNVDGYVEGETGEAPDHTHPILTNYTGGSGAHLNVQPSIIMNFIIRTGV